MEHNDILRRLRYAFDFSDSDMSGIFKLAGHDISESSIPDIIKREEDEGYVETSDTVLGLFLDGLIILKRGKKETPDSVPAIKTEVTLSNNMILKKLRIALAFKEHDMFEMFRLAEYEITKPELSALFRKKGQKNYKVCGDQIVKKFIKGLTVYHRK